MIANEFFAYLESRRAAWQPEPDHPCPCCGHWCDCGEQPCLCDCWQAPDPEHSCGDPAHSYGQPAEYFDVEVDEVSHANSH